MDRQLFSFCAMEFPLGLRSMPPRKAVKAGAANFLTKAVDDEELLKAVRQALERSRLALAQEAQIQGLRDRPKSLTPREMQVMALVVPGLLNKQIADELGINEKTVKAHRGQVMQKMKANSVADLVKMAEKLPLRQA
jgi:FixJ family two-component response regulator